MYLIASLNAGFAAAPLGHAEIYVRGSSTRATWYASLEGDGANSTGANITLDAQGSALVYVNQLVDVVVKDVDGVSVRSFGDGVAAPNVEVRSSAFTGIDYDTAASAAGNPTNLKAMADLWLTKNGAIDWQVLFNGAATTIQSALGPLVGLVYNVMSPAYGGVGDGVASDQSAVAAALAAAVAAGGGVVFFPEGTYRLTSAISWDNSVAILGVGMNKSVITMDAAATKTLRFTSANTTAQPTLIMGVTFQSSQSNTGTIVDIEAQGNVRFVECSFGGNTNSLGTQIDVNASSTKLACERCIFNVRSATLPAITTDSATTGNSARVADCTFIGPASFTGALCDLQYTSQAFVSNNYFDCNTNSTTGTYYCVQVGTGQSVISGSRFQGGTIAFCVRVVGTGGGSHGVSITGNAFSNYTGILECTAAAKVRMAGNVAGSNYLYTLADVLAEGSFLEMAPFDRNDLGGAAATVPNARETVSYFSSSTVPTFTMPAIYFPGQPLRLEIINNSGGAWASNVTFTGAQLYGTTDTTATPGEIVIAEFVASDVASDDTYTWVGHSVKLGSA